MSAALAALPFLLVISLVGAMLAESVRNSGDKVVAALLGVAQPSSTRPSLPVSRRARVAPSEWRSPKPLHAAA